MNKQQIKELRAHAGKLVAEGKPLNMVFERFNPLSGEWNTWGINSFEVPHFNDGSNWRIAQPKKQLINWSHPYFKECATNYGQVLFAPETKLDYVHVKSPIEYSVDAVARILLRLATPANEDSNWQYFRSTPENDAKLRELAKMVNVEVRVWNHEGSYFKNLRFGRDLFIFESICNYRITGLQDGWTDNPEEAL